MENDIMEKIIMLHPCPISGKYIAEFNLENRLSISVLCSKLQNFKVHDLRYSEELGIVKFDFEEKRVILDSNGKISISRINDLKEAEIFISKIKKIVQKTFL